MGAEDAKNGKLNEEMDCLVNDSQLRLLVLGNFEVGEERGGVTGALLEIRRGGSEDGIEYTNGLVGLDGLGNDDDDGLHWYEGIGLGFWEEDGVVVVVVDVPPVSMEGSGGLEPCNHDQDSSYKTW